MAEKTGITKSIFLGIWNVLNFSRRLLLNIIFFAIIIGVIIAISSGGDDQLVVEKKSALVLDLKGNLVIEKTYVDPTEAFIQEATGQEPENPEILVRELVKVINNAKDDSDIETIILRLERFSGGGLDKLRKVAQAIENFKTSGKPVYAIADYYNRNQYYLAAHADNVYLNPMGGMLIEGYAYYGSYYKEALEKLKASPHVFKVGKYKSAVEPFIRNDMSPEAKEANAAWLNELWVQYKTEVAAAREFETHNFDETFDVFLEKFENVNGDFAEYALNNGWVDGLRTREEFRQEITELLGKGKNDSPFNSVSYHAYLNLISPKVPVPEGDGDKVAIVVAKGTILDGDRKPGTIGGDSTARLLRKARQDNKVKAVVLQVDSGGGSAFASEVIRQEIELLKAAGKPVVASMSTYAASGGYWISASADHILAEPNTITGSIGIFGFFATFERSFNYLGIHSDGVSTNELNGIAIDRPLSSGYASFIQMNIERGYDRFISLVANEREMTKEAVDEIAQGRVWIGTQALELGLVDELGGVDRAVEKAAELAEISEYKTTYIKRQLTKEEQFLQQLFNASAKWFDAIDLSVPVNPLMQIAKDVEKEIAEISQLNDPDAAYVLCMECRVE
ncbi:signal peptide peptidase SppA [Agaribacter flavus]|uniref:Signal peptide peptidase SppA n=1 Tax=Agaribacter flavus TaxID=1902781 RepID=A0ABV7FNM2_9ALTE